MRFRDYSVAAGVCEVAVTVVDVVVSLIALGFDIFQLVNNLVQSRGPRLYSPVKLPPYVINRECVTVCVCVCMQIFQDGWLSALGGR